MLRTTVSAIALSVFLAPAAANAASYYLASSGNDANPGTQARPWKTVNGIYTHAKLQPGDKLLFNGGDWFFGTLYMDTTLATTADGSPLTISSYGTGRANLWNYGKVINIYNIGNVSITNINTVEDGGQSSSGQGIILTNDKPGTTLKNIVIDNVDVGWSGAGSEGLFLSSAYSNAYWQNISITNSKFHDNIAAGVFLWAPQSSTPPISNVYISFVEAYNNSGDTGSSGSGILLSGVSGAKVEYSSTHHNAYTTYAVGGPYGLWVYESDGVTFQYNESYANTTQSDHDGGGFDFDGGVTNSVMQYNYAHDNDGPGILMCSFYGTVTQSNTIRYNVLENNVMRNTVDGSLMAFSADGPPALVSNRIYNNTIFHGNSVDGSYGVLMFGGSTDLSIRNNIIYTTGGKGLMSISDTNNRLAIQGNDYWSDGWPFYIDYKGSGKTSLSQFRSSTGQEKLPIGTGSATGFNRNPMLTSPGGGGTRWPGYAGTMAAYRLQAGSPMINTALNLRSLFLIDPGSMDFFYNTIPNGTGYDIGANER